MCDVHRAAKREIGARLANPATPMYAVLYLSVQSYLIYLMHFARTLIYSEPFWINYVINNADSNELEVYIK